MGYDVLASVTDLKIVLGIFVLGMALYLFSLARMVTGEKRINFITLFIFLIAYNFIMTLIWLIALGYFVLGRKPGW